MKKKQDVPEFIDPKNVLQLTDEQLDAEIAARQTRRLAAFRVYEETLKRKNETRNEKLRARLERELQGFAKSLKSIDKNLDSLKDRVNKIRGIRLELDDKFDMKKDAQL